MGPSLRGRVMSENRSESGVSTADERAREVAFRRLVPEVRTALNNAPDVRVWPPSWHDDEWVDYFYHSGCLLTRDRDLARVQDVLRDLGARRDEGGDARIRRHNQARRKRPGVAAHPTSSRSSTIGSALAWPHSIMRSSSLVTWPARPPNPSQSSLLPRRRPRGRPGCPLAWYRRPVSWAGRRGIRCGHRPWPCERRGALDRGCTTGHER